MLLNFANFSSGAEWKGSGLSWSESSTVFSSHIWSCHQQLEALDDCLFQLVQPQWVGERSCELLSSEPLWCWHCRQRKGQQHHSIESPLITVTVWTVSASVARVPLAVGICSSMAGPVCTWHVSDFWDLPAVSEQMPSIYKMGLFTKYSVVCMRVTQGKLWTISLERCIYTESNFRRSCCHLAHWTRLPSHRGKCPFASPHPLSAPLPCVIELSDPFQAVTQWGPPRSFMCIKI